MKTLYKVAISLGITEWIYFIIAMINGVNLLSIFMICVLGLSGLACYLIQYKKNNAISKLNEGGKD